jgi:hypothetical protein
VEPGQVWANVKGGYRAKVKSVEVGQVNYLYNEWGSGDVWRRGQGGHDRLSVFEDGTLTLLSPVAKPAECGHVVGTGQCRLRVDELGEHRGGHSAWQGDTLPADAPIGCRCARCKPAPAKPPVAQGAKCEGSVDSLHSGAVLRRVIFKSGKQYALCDGCYLSNEPSGGGSDLLHNDKAPERLTSAQLASDYYDDCLPGAGR